MREPEIDQSSLEELFDFYSDHPVEFAQNILKADLEKWQSRAMRAAVNHNKIAIKSAHGVGKTAFEAMLCLWYLGSRAFSKVPTTAPTFERQVREVLWAEIHKWYRNSPLLQEVFEMTSVSLRARRAKEEWFAVGFSVENAMNETEAGTMEGYHAPHMMALIDEAKGVSKSIYTSIKGALTGIDDKLIVASTPPLNHEGAFVEIFDDLENLCDGNCGLPLCQKWFAMTVTAYDTVGTRHTLAWIEERKQEWGEDSPIFQAKVLGQIPDVDEDLFFPIRLAEASMDKTFEMGNECILGVDIARYGSDWTVWTVRRGPQVTRMEKAPVKLDTMESAGRTLKIMREEMPKYVMIDQIGIGAGVVDRLKEVTKDNPEYSYTHIQGVDVGGGARDSEHYKNLRAELYDACRTRLIEGTLALPKNYTILDEMRVIKYKYDSNGRLVIESKEDLRKKGLPSPDHLDSLILTFARPRIPWKPVLNGASLDVYGR